MNQSLGQKLRAYVALSRPLNSFLGGFAPVVSVYISDPSSPVLAPLRALFILIAGYSVSAQGMVINDYFDREIDAINSPGRPIPSGRVSPREALYLAVGLIAVALLSGIGIDLLARSQGFFSPVPFVSVWFVVVFSALLDLYNWKLKAKGIIGNSIVALSVAVLFVYGDIQGAGHFTPIPSALAFAAFFFNVGREIIKTIPDIEGDRSQGVTTVATLLGARGAAILGALIIYLGSIPALWILLAQRSSLGIIGQFGFASTILIAFISVTYNALHPSGRTAWRTKRIILWLFMHIMLLTFIDALLR